MNNIDINVVLAIIFMIMVLYLLAKLLVRPMKIFIKVAVNTVGGLVLLVAFNFLGSFAGISVGVNLLTALIVGIMGIPGIIGLIFLQSFYT